MPIADRMIPRVAAFSVIKDMFEEGRRLKAEFGPTRYTIFPGQSGCAASR